MITDTKIAFFGSSEFSILVLEKLKKLGINPDLIVSIPDKPQGRKLILTPNEVKTWAENNSIEYITPHKLKDDDVYSKLKQYDLFIVASYGKIIPKEIIDMPKYHTLNIHPSILPNYRGPSPLQEQILQDEKHVGVTIMEIDDQVDHGAIIEQREVEIKNWPIGYNALEKLLAEVGAEILAEILPDWMRGKIPAKIQNHSDATFTKKFEKGDGLIHLHDDPMKNYLKYLAFENWPGIYFMQNGKRVKITSATFQNNQFKIEKIIPEGKKEMSYEDYIRGQK